MCWIKVGDFGAKRDDTSIGRLRAPQLSRDMSLEADLLCDSAAVPGDTIKETPIFTSGL
jgi:hypothetical protein